MRGSSRITAVLTFICILCLNSHAFSNHLDLINPEKLPPEAVPVLDQMREIEHLAAEYHHSWEFTQPKDDVIKTVTSLYEKLNSVLEKNSGNGELLLMMGILCHYGHNLDISDYSSKADTSFIRSAKALPDDYRPLWFAGMHYTKSSRILEGYKSFLDTDKRFSPENPWFWADYAMNLYVSSMPRNALLAIDKAEKLNGRKISWCETMAKAIRSKIKTPDPEAIIPRDELWHVSKKDSIMTIKNFPAGMKVMIPAAYGSSCFLSEYKNRNTIMHLFGTPIKKGKKFYGPEVLIMCHIPKKNETLDAFKKIFLYKETVWKPYDMAMKLGESTYSGDTRTPKGKKTGSRTIMVFLERPSPPYSGIGFEEPQNEFGEKPQGPSFYRLADFYERFGGTIFYMILLEAPKPVFDKSLDEFKRILEGFIVE